MGGTLEVPEISMERQSVRVLMSSVWPEQRTTYIHQVIEAHPCKTLPSGNETNNVFGRYVGDGTEQGRTREPPSSDISFGAVGFCGQLGEISIDTCPGNSLPWFHCGLQGDEDKIIRGEGDADLNDLQENQGERMQISERIGQANWQDDSNSPCSTTVVPRAPTPKEPGLSEVSIFQVHGDTESVGPRRAGLVVS